MVLGLLFVLVSVHGHAVLKSPIPFNTNPSTSQPCGTGNNDMPNSVSAEWTAGSEVLSLTSQHIYYFYHNHTLLLELNFQLKVHFSNDFVQVQITWSLVAGDGAGVVKGAFDPNGIIMNIP